MGAGESVYVQKQEAFVRENRDKFRKELPEYSRGQIEGKLRQMYAGTDNLKCNERSYINSNSWNKSRSNVSVSYPENKYYYT